MAQNIGHMRVLLSASTGQHDRAIAKSGKAVEKFAYNVGHSIGSTIRTFAKWGAALAPIVAGGGMALLVKRSLDNIDAMGKMSDQINATTEGLGKLSYAGSLAGVEFEALSMGMQKMVNSISEATKGEGQGVKALKQLGLEADKLNRMKSDEQFLTIADAISRVTNRADQLRMTLDIFGRSGGPLINLLRLGRTGLEAMGLEAEKLGVIFSRIDAAQVEAANDAITRMRSAFTGVANTIAIKIAPVIEFISNKFIDWVKGGEGVRATVEKIANALEDGIAGALNAVEKAIRGFASMVLDLMSTIMGEAGLMNARMAKALEKIPVVGKHLAEHYRQSAIGFSMAAGKLHEASVEIGRTPDILTGDKFKQKMEKIRTESLDSAMNALSNIPSGEALPDLEAFNEMLDEASKIVEETRTPFEKYSETLGKLNRLYNAGALDNDTYMRAVEQAAATLQKENTALEEKAGLLEKINNEQFEQVKLARTAFSLARFNPRGRLPGYGGRLNVPKINVPKINVPHFGVDGMSGTAEPPGVRRAAQTQMVRDPQLAETNTILRMIASSSRFPVAVAG